jgi:TP901 family phage tail tape measure protein
MADVNANINIGINTSQAQAQLLKLQNQISAFNKSLAISDAGYGQMLSRGINATRMFDAQIVPATTSVERFSRAIENNKLSLGQYARLTASQLPGLGKVFRSEFDMMEKVAVSRVKKIQSQYVALGKSAKNTQQALQIMPRGLAQGYATDIAVATQKQVLFNKLLSDGSTKLLNWGKNTQWAGRQLMVGLTLPMAAFGAAAAKAFMELDKATVALSRVYGDLSTTTQELDRNVDAVKRLGAEYTKYGISVKDTIDISARAAATGAKNESLLAATEQTLRFATLGQMDYNNALDTTISLQTAFGISNDKLGEKIDYLNAVENQTILTMEDMSLAIPRVATVIKGLGGDVEDLAVMMTAMREGGVSAENAANALKSGLASMINPTRAAQQALAKLGIDMNGIVQANKGDLLGTIRAFGAELNKLGSFERQQALEKVFGKYQYARMSALFTNITKQSSQAARAMDLATMSAQDLANIANKELSKVSESTTVKFQAALEKLKISIAPLGEAFLKAITPIINLVSKVADAFNNLPDGVKNAMAVATAAIAGIGPVLLMGIGLMGNLIANVIKGVEWWRKLGARLKGTSSQFEFLTETELLANSATMALEGSSGKLTRSLLLQKGAVSALTTEYERFVTAAGVAGTAMGGVATGGRTGKRNLPNARMRFAEGGTVPGTGNKDTIPALLTPGESVITKEATKKYAPILHQMNNGTLPGFNSGWVNLFKSITTKVGGARAIMPNIRPSSRVVKEPGALGYNILERQSGSRGAAWQEGYGYLPEVSKLAGRTRVKAGKVVGHIYSKEFYQRFGGVGTTGSSPRLLGRDIPGQSGRKLNPQRYHDVLPSQYILIDENWNKLIAPNSLKKATANDWKPVSGRDMISVLQMLMSRGVPENIAMQVASKAAQILNTRIRQTYGSIDEILFGEIATGSSVQALKSSSRLLEQYGPREFAGGVVGLQQSLRTWQTSSRQVRETPEMLFAIMSGMKPTRKNMKLHRSTTLGLSRGSEFIPQDEAMIFEALKNGNLEGLIGKTLTAKGPISYTSAGISGTYGALSSNSDVNRIEFLKQQTRIDRKSYRNNISRLKRYEEELARYETSGASQITIDAIKRRIAETKQYIETAKNGRGMLGKEIKSLAPKGYRNLLIEQSFGAGHPMINVNKANPGGTYMGRDVSHEQEFIASGSKMMVTGVSIDPKTGLPILQTKTLQPFATGGTVPGVGNSDTVPALLTPGESVITKKATQKYGSIISAMNNGTLPGFAFGTGEGGVPEPSGRVGASGRKVPWLQTLASLEKKDPRRAAMLRAQLAEEMYVQQAMVRAGYSARDIPVAGGHLEQRPGMKTSFQDVKSVPPQAQAFNNIAQSLSDPRVTGVGHENQIKAAQIKRDAIQKALFNITKKDAKAQASVPKLMESLSKGSKLTYKQNQLLAKAFNELSTNTAAYQKELGQLSKTQQRKFIKTGGQFIAGAEAQKYYRENVGKNPSLRTTSFSAFEAQATRTTATTSVRQSVRSSDLLARQLMEKYPGMTERQAITAAKRMSNSAYKRAMTDWRNGVLTGEKPNAKTVGAELSKRIAVPMRGTTAERRANLETRKQERLSRQLEQRANRIMARRPSLTSEQAQIIAGRQMGIVERQSNAKILAEREAAAKREAYARKTKAMMGGAGLLALAPMVGPKDEQGKFLGMDPFMAMIGAQMIAQPLVGGIRGAVGKSAKYGGPGFGYRALPNGEKAVTRTGAMSKAFTAGLSKLPGLGALGSIGAGGAIAVTGGVAAAFAALAITAWTLKKGMDNTIDAGKKYADALTISTKEQNDIAALFGRTTLASRRRAKDIQKNIGLTTKEQQMGAEFVKTEPGKAMLEEMKVSLEKGGTTFGNNLASQIGRLIVSGAVNPKQAKAIVVGLTEALGKPEMAIPIITKVEQIVGPNGQNLSKDPLKVIDNLINSIDQTNNELTVSSERAAKQATNSWTDNFLGLGILYSGEMDAMIEADIARANAYLENTKQILTAIDDEISRQDILIARLKEKRGLEDDKKKKAGYTSDIKEAQANKKALEERRAREEADRRQRAINMYTGGGNVDQKFTAGFGAVEEATGIMDLEGAVNRAISDTKLAREVQAAAVKPEELSQETRNRLMANGVLAYRSITPGGKPQYVVQQQAAYQNEVKFDPNFKAMFPEMNEDQIKASLLVDIELGKVDPKTLATLDMLDQGTKGLALKFYLKGNYKEFADIAAIGSMGDDVKTAFAEIQKDTKYTEDQIAGLAGVLVSLGNDVDRSKLLEAFRGGADGIDDFIKSAKTLQDMKLDLASIFAVGGIAGVNKAAEAIDGITGALKKNSKAIGDIKKQKTFGGKLEKTIDVVTKVATDTGEEYLKDLDPEKVRASLKDIADKTGMSQKQVLNLPPDVIVSSIVMDISGDELIKQGQGMISSATVGILQNVPEAQVLYKQGQALVDMGNQLNGAALSSVINAKKPWLPINQPQGGTKTDYVKDMMKGFLDQVNIYADAGATMKKLTSSTYDFAKKIAAQGKANGGLIQQLRNLGLSENIIAQLASQGKDALAQAVKKYAGKRDNAKVIGANLAEQRATISRLMGQATERVGAAQRTLSVTRTLAGRGLSPELIQSITNDQEFVNLINKKGGGKEKRQQIEGIIAKYKEELALIKQIAREQDPIQTKIDDETIAHERANRLLEKDIQIEQDKIDAIQQQIDLLNEMNDADQQRIRTLEREKEMIQRKIDSYERENEMDQRSIESLRRQDEMRNRISDNLSHELELMSQQEDKIRKSYDERIKALDTIASINDHILNQQKNQLSVAQALSQGDIYAAAQATQGMQAEQVQFVTQQQRDALEKGMENQIAGLRTSGGLTRDQAEQQINDIKEQSYQVSLRIRDIEDQIYNRNLTITSLKDQIYNKDLSIRGISDIIYGRETEILNIQNNQLKPVQTRLSFLEKQKEIQDRIFNDRVDELNLQAEQAGMTDDQIKKVGVLAQQWQEVSKQIKSARDNADLANKNLGIQPIQQAGEPDESYKNRLKKWQDAKKTISETERNAINAAYGTGMEYFKTLKFATGGRISGNGSRDSIAAQLTPGEYVIRKSAVNKYGAAMFDKINMGSFEMPRYNIPRTTSVNARPSNVSTTVAPVYNSYSINVPVNNPGASAEEIAHVVMTKIRGVEGASIRRINGY